MTSRVQPATGWGRSPWRYLMWTAAAALMVAALWAWDLVRQGEYALVTTAALFAAVCVVVERAAATSARWAYGAGMALAVLAGLGQLWVTLAVGLIGSEDDPVNLAFFGVVGVALLASLIARGRARTMVWAMAAAIAAQVIAGIVGTAVELGTSGMRAGGMLLLTLYLVALWLNAAALFRIAAGRGA